MIYPKTTTCHSKIKHKGAGGRGEALQSAAVYIFSVHLHGVLGPLCKGSFTGSVKKLQRNPGHAQKHFYIICTPPTRFAHFFYEMSVFPQPQRGLGPCRRLLSWGGLGLQISLKIVLERSCANTFAKVGPKVAQVRPKTSKTHQD